MIGQQAFHNVRAGASAILQWLTRTSVHIQTRTEVKALQKTDPMLLIYEKRFEDLVEFGHHYENLVEALCDAAQKGIDAKLEAVYQTERRWLETHYFFVRPYVVAYLKLDSEDDEQSIALQGHAADAFQTLYAAPDLTILIESDNGNMISRIVRTREALSAYAEHLRQLIDREKSCS